MRTLMHVGREVKFAARNPSLSLANTCAQFSHRANKGMAGVAGVTERCARRTSWCHTFLFSILKVWQV
jgi:hypothetical protein